MKAIIFKVFIIASAFGDLAFSIYLINILIEGFQKGILFSSFGYVPIVLGICLTVLMMFYFFLCYCVVNTEYARKS